METKLDALIRGADQADSAALTKLNAAPIASATTVHGTTARGPLIATLSSRTRRVAASATRLAKTAFPARPLLRTTNGCASDRHCAGV